MSTRREFLLGLAAVGGLAKPGFVSRIERSVLWRGRSGGITWFHLRACAIPARPRPRVFMTLQQISGSDLYGPVHWSESADLGATWSAPALIPGMGRRTLPDGTEEGFCDTVPEYHRPSASVLALAANVYYRDGKLTRPNEGRWPEYIIRSGTGRWSERPSSGMGQPGGRRDLHQQLLAARDIGRRPYSSSAQLCADRAPGPGRLYCSLHVEG